NNLRILNRYDVTGITSEEYTAARKTIFSEPPLDQIFEETFPLQQDEIIFAAEYLPGQYDQRADSAAQCVQIITLGKKPLISTARIIVLKGNVSPGELAKIKRYVINPVDSKEAALEKPQTLHIQFQVPGTVERLEGFIHFSNQQLENFRESHQLAMSLQDLLFCQSYFKEKEKRDPFITEIKMLDTYWSD
ncbi:MAG: phosphoribosylformylglycinamidine synthase, partial [bacterium]|nr:phosphoribosylformylglycinamidine synthase [bacterium]